MNLFGYIRESFQALTQNKLRSVLSLLGIIIGISSVVILTAIGDGMKRDILEQFSATRNLITIGRGRDNMSMMGNASSMRPQEPLPPDPLQVALTEQIFTEDMVKKIEKTFGNDIIAVVPVYQWAQQGSNLFEGKEVWVNIRVVDDAFFRARNIAPHQGMLWSSVQKEQLENAVVVGASTISQVFDNTNPLGKTLIIG